MLFIFIKLSFLFLRVNLIYLINVLWRNVTFTYRKMILKTSYCGPGELIFASIPADTHDVRGAGDLQRERQREGEGEEALEGDHQGEERHHWRLEGELE